MFLMQRMVWTRGCRVLIPWGRCVRLLNVAVPLVASPFQSITKGDQDKRQKWVLTRARDCRQYPGSNGGPIGQMVGKLWIFTSIQWQGPDAAVLLSCYVFVRGSKKQKREREYYDTHVSRRLNFEFSFSAWSLSKTSTFEVVLVLSVSAQNWGGGE